MDQKQPKNNLWNFRVNDELIDRLFRASRATDRPAAQIVREAIREKLDELAAKHPQIDVIPAQQPTATN